MSTPQEILDNPKSQRIKRIAELHAAKARKKYEKTLIEAPQAVREALTYLPESIQDVYYCTESMSAHSVERVQGLVAQAISQRIYVHEVSARVMQAISTDAQGIIAVASTQNMHYTLAQFKAYADQHQSRMQGYCAALWQIRDPGNAGTVIRSADAAGCDAVLFIDECVDPTSPKVIRATAGSFAHIPLVHASMSELIEYCKQSQTALYAADVYGTDTNPAMMLNTALEQSMLASEIMLLFGNEARGLPASTLQACDRVITIPMYGNAESMNLASSAAILLHSIAMARHA